MKWQISPRCFSEETVNRFLTHLINQKISYWVQSVDGVFYIHYYHHSNILFNKKEDFS